MKNNVPSWLTSWRVVIPVLVILLAVTFALPKLNGFLTIIVVVVAFLVFIFRRTLIGGTVSMLGTRSSNNYLFSEEYEKAVEFSTQQIAKYPRDVVARLTRSTAYIHLGNLEAARADCEAALALDPKSVYTLNNRAVISMQEDNLPAALADVQQALSIQPDNPVLLYNRGAVYARMDKDEAAQKDFDDAIEIEPDQAATYAGRGNVAFKDKDIAAALEDYKKACELSEETHQFSAGLAVAEFASGKVADAQKRWQALPTKYTPYANPDWQRRVLNWPDAMTIEAGKLVASLSLPAASS
ncbi:MAG: tetratricopeptide repeat protein [Chloroflexota bacterium]